MKEYRIFGPPGTGKTTRLVDMIQETIDKFGPYCIMVGSFSLAAKAELMRRKIDLPDDQIGTLHSISYRLIGSPRYVTDDQIDKWNAQYRGHDSWQIARGDMVMPLRYRSEKSEVTACSSYRNALVPEDQWPPSSREFYKAWKEFKNLHQVVDYTDCLERCVTEGIFANRIKYFFVDEVQDCSPLQMKMVRHLAKTCDMLILAGDDDQCIYSFLGCDPKTFTSDDSADEIEEEVLMQSYRVPQRVHRAAERWITKVSHRHEKPYAATEEIGICETYRGTYKKLTDLNILNQQIDSGKSVMLIASCSYMVKEIIDQLRRNFIPYSNVYRDTNYHWNTYVEKAEGSRTVISRVRSFLRISEDKQAWKYKEVQRWTQLTKNEERYRKQITKASQDEGYCGLVAAFEDLDIWYPHGEDREYMINGDLDWLAERCVDEVKEQVQYLANMKQKYGTLKAVPFERVTVGTIHSVKGAEADIVYLFPDLSPVAVHSDDVMTHDSTTRTFYVGMTRAKHSLYLANPVQPRFACDFSSLIKEANDGDLAAAIAS